MDTPGKDKKALLYMLLGLIVGAAATFYFLNNDNTGLKEKIKERVDGLKEEVKKWQLLPEEEAQSLISKARKLLDDLESFLKEEKA